MNAPHPDAPANETAEAALTRAPRGRIEPVLIAGGGIGGLATAIALARRGIPSHVLERRPTFHDEGAGIQIAPNGTRILRRLGVADALYPRVGVPETICMRDGLSGEAIVRLPLGQWIATRHGAPYWVVLRSDLHAALLNAVREEPLIALSMGFPVVELAADEEMVAVVTSSGHAWTGRALIAADGLWSAVRNLEFRCSPPRFIGKSATRCVLPIELLPPEFYEHETGVWLFPDAHVVHYPVAAGAALAVAIIASDERNDGDWDAPVPPVWVQAHLPPCAEPLHDLITQAHTWRRWTLHASPVPQSWARGLIALLGDAAHPILPFLAQGGSLALEDAAVLADILSSSGHDVAGALKRYQGRRRQRAVRVASASRQNGRIYQLSGALATARNLGLRTMAPERLMARYDWLFGWRPD